MSEKDLHKNEKPYVPNEGRNCGGRGAEDMEGTSEEVHGVETCEKEVPLACQSSTYTRDLNEIHG